MSIITFEQRRAKIHTVDDIDEQIRLAKQYAKQLRAKAKKQNTLEEKIAFNEKVKAAEKAFRQLRMASFDIEDELNAKIMLGEK